VAVDTPALGRAAAPEDLRLARRVAGTFAANVAAAAVSLLNVLITSRVLGPTGRGELVFVLTVAALTSTLATCGIDEANGNLAAIEPERRPSLASNTVVLALLLGGAAAVAVGALVFFVPATAPDAEHTLLWAALAVVPLQIFQAASSFLIRADYRFAISNVAVLVAPVLTLVVNGALAAAGVLSVTTAFTVWACAQILVVALLGWYILCRLSGFGRPDAQLAFRMLGFGVKAHAGRVMKTGNYRLDQWLLGSMAGSRELGLYSVAVAWSEALFYLPEALGIVMRPDLVRATPAQASARGAAAVRVAIVLTAPFALLLVVAAPILCVTVFGESFGGSVDDLRVLAFGAFGMVALKLLANALTAQRKPMLANAALAVAFAVTIVLDVVLISRYGGVGAAAASTVAYTVGGLAVALIFVRTLHGRMRDFRPGRRDLRALARAARKAA
jgi:O-antigen/teichoic acid export membrane protein